MKGKNLSKVLAFLLAAVMIFSALPLMAFASDEAETYTVSYGAPAIPMNEMTVVNLADISVEMEKGTVVSGADITWAADAQVGIEFDAAAKTVFAKVAGKYKLTATANGITKNVWVLVKKEADTEFVLIDYNFAKGYNPDEWQLIKWSAKGQGTGYDADPAVNPGLIEYKNGYIGMGLNNGVQESQKWQSRGILISKDPIFNDFADYTITSSMATKAIGTLNGWGGPGHIGRAKLTAEGNFDADHNEIIYYILGFGSLRLGSHKSLWWAERAYTCDASILKADAGTLSGLTGEYLWTTSNAINEYHELKTIYSGDNFATYLDGVEHFNLSKASDTIKTKWANADNYAVEPGAPGFMTWAATTRTKTFKVTLNSNELAPARKVNYYNVSFGAPAIPMNENTGVDLKFVNVEMTKGNLVSGADITWTAESQEGLYVNNAGKKISVYTAGNYKVTATYNGVSKDVWVVAKKASDTDFYLVNYDFTVDKFVPEEWNLIYYNKHGGTVGTAKATDGTNPAYFTNNSGKANGYILVAPNNGQETNASGSKLWVNHGVLVNNNPIFKDFADYTVITSMRTNANLTNQWSGAGVVGRVNLAEDGTFDPNVSSVIGYLQGNGNMMIESHIGGAWANGKKTYEGSLVNSESTENSEKYYWNSAVYHTMTTKFDTDNIVYNVNNIANTETIEIFDLSKADSSVQTKWATDGYNATQPGFPGVIAWDGGCRLQKFAVKLNSNAMPDAIAAEVAPEAEIIITGEGDAEVEAVVGSDNTYTVEIAPAEGYKVKVGSLVIDGKRVLDSDVTGRVYTFTSEDLNATTISVEYIPDDGTFNSMMLGATIPVNPEKKGIRFGARTDFIRRNGETGFLGDKLLVDGVVYAPTEVGMLFIPSVLIDGELTVDTERATRQAVSKVVKLTGDFSDIAITLVGIPESFFGVQISSRMYVAYEVDGETKYVYTEVIERSYNDVVAAIGK